jgi:transcriptional regulator with XRE-family HTH domain
MNTSTTLYEHVMTQLRARTIPQRRVARESGVPFSTLCKIAQGAVKEPSVHTIQRLADYFDRVSNVGPMAERQENEAA